MCIAWSPSSNLLATASKEGTARIWNMDDHQALTAITLSHGKAVLYVDWNVSEILI